jgi:lysophospholipid acyltransferase (LPLAT)-like uncharacterized protein
MEERTERKERKFFLNWPAILAVLILLYYKIVRFRILGDPLPKARPVIYITWHSEEITMLPKCGFTKANIMVSASKDGDILAIVAKRFGYATSRGSSSKRAAAALISLKNAILRGESIILAVDGPRGPRRVPKIGAFYLSAKFGAPIVPVGVAVSRAYVFKKSWSKSRVPLPGAKVVGIFDHGYVPSKEDQSLSKEAQSQKLFELLENATGKAEEELRAWKRGVRPGDEKKEI